MNRALVLTAAFVVVSCATTPPLTHEQMLVNRAIDTMGGAARLAAVNTASVRGSAKQWEPEQSDMPDGEMRFANDTSFELLQDRAKRASRADIERRFAYPAPRTFKFSEIVTPQAGFVLGVDSNSRNAQDLKMDPPAHSMSSLRLAAAQREGLRASASALMVAMRNNPGELRPASDLQVGLAAYPAVGYGPFLVGFDRQSGLPAVVRTLDYDNVWGDVNYDTLYADWRDAGGILVPMKRTYALNGRPVQEVELTDVRFNVPIDAARLEVPAELRADAAKPASGFVPYQWVIRRQFIGVYLDSENTSFDARATQSLRLNDIAPGVVQVAGGTHNSLLVEMSDHLVMVDAPISDAQSNWVLNAARARFPGKPIRWLVLTHHHMDHTGGLRAILAEGAILVVGPGTSAHYRKALAAPMYRNPDMKPVDFSAVPILEVPDSHVMRDSQGREVVAYVIQNNPHAKGMLMAYVPDAKLGWVTDLWNPGQPLPDKPNPALISVVRTVQRAGIEPTRFAGGHGSVADYAPLAKLAGQ